MTHQHEPVVVKGGGGGASVAIVAIVVLAILAVVAFLAFTNADIFINIFRGGDSGEENPPAENPPPQDPLPTIPAPSSRLLSPNLSG